MNNLQGCQETLRHPGMLFHPCNKSSHIAVSNTLTIKYSIDEDIFNRIAAL